MHLTASRCIRMHPKRSEQVRAGPSNSENLKKLVQTFANSRNTREKFDKISAQTCSLPSNFPVNFLRNFPKVSECIRTHPDASECIRTGPNRSEQVPARPKTQKTCKNLRKHRICRDFLENSCEHAWPHPAWHHVAFSGILVHTIPPNSWPPSSVRGLGWVQFLCCVTF